MPGYELYDHIERKELMDVIESGIFMRYGFDGARNGHWKSKEMEAALCEKLGVNHAHLLSSGTAALHTTLAALGVGAGDEVIMPTFTFVASFESVLQAGATPVLVDIDESLCLDPKAVEAAITPQTKVVMPVHMCGAMARIDELSAICKRHQLFLLEDACQAFGGTYKGRHLGTIGDAGCFSFDFVKTVTCAEGGAVVTNNPDVYARAHQFSDHGHDHIGNDRGAEQHPCMGVNYRISELHAAVGLGQIKKLDHFLQLQRRNHAILREALATVPGLSFRHIPDPDGDTATFLSFFLPDESAARKAAQALKAGGIDGVFYYYDNNWHYIRSWHHLKNVSTMMPLSAQLTAFLTAAGQKSYPASDAIMSREISMAIKIGWTEEEVRERARKCVEILK
jgi:Predicted pyridoxal phosphate-dependent enzyme apparently involved in regulation of cell wall biogenesis